MKFVTYTRVSTKEQGRSGLGLEGQKSLLNHYLVDCDVVAEFSEVASGKGMGKRPELKRAIDLCVKHGYTLAVAKVDRLSRTTEDALYIRTQLDNRIYCCNLPQQPNEPCDKFMLTMFMMIADKEREMISIRTKQALQAKHERDGAWFQPEWSNLDSDARQRGADAMRAKSIEANKSASYTAKMLRDTGASYANIAKELNANGYLTATGKPFQPMTVKRILDRLATV